jgi:hypothetical protein
VHREHHYQSEGYFHPTTLDRIYIPKLPFAELDLVPHCNPLQSQQATMRTGQRTRCTSRGRPASPALSDYSDLTVLSRSPSPPTTPRGRQPSPALSDSSGVSMLSHSPSPPPGLIEKIEISLQSTLPKRGRNGRFLPKGAKREASPMSSTR